MKALKVKLYQPVACYRKPLSFGVVETFFLPPFSTIKGWVHYTAGAEKEHSLSVSIHGRFETVGYQLQKFKKFDRKREGQPELPGFSKTLISSPVYVQELYEVYLTIYIAGDQELLSKFLENLLIKDFISIGRKEDTALLIQEPEFVELEPFKAPRFLRIKDLTLLTRETAEKIGLFGTFYRLGLCYDEELKELTGWRYFRKKRDFLVVNPTSKRLRENPDSIYVDPEDGRAVEMVELETCSEAPGQSN